MKKTNPWKKFFTADFYPDEGEPVNAFWGYHVANNITRLLNVDGTIVFGTLEYGEQLDKEPLIAVIPTGALQFNAAPVIQFWARRTWQDALSTHTVYGTTVPYTMGGATLSIPLRGEDMVIRIGNLTYHSERALHRWFEEKLNPFKPGNHNDKLIKFGTSGCEVMRVLTMNSFVEVPGSVPNQGIYGMQLVVQRGYWGPGNEYHHPGEAMMIVGPESYEFTEIITQSSAEDWNPVYVEGFLDVGRLIVKFMDSRGGTVYFKIFGV